MQAAAHEEELRAVHREVYGEAGHETFARQFRVWRRQRGFVLVEARHGDYLLGFAAGMPLRPSTSWWKDLTTSLPAGVTTEHPGRTFALTELLVRASWRRQGIAGSLHDLILDGRPEERATLAVPPGATAAQKAFRKWGWSRVARTHGPHHGSPALDVLIIALPASRRPIDARAGVGDRTDPPRPGRYRRRPARRPPGQPRSHREESDVVARLAWNS